MANNADDGLWDATEDSPDAIIVDYRMPLISGAGFLYRLREVPTLRAVPVVVITGDTTVGDALGEELAQLGAHYLRYKPVAIDGLIGTLETLLAGKPHWIGRSRRMRSTPRSGYDVG